MTLLVGRQEGHPIPHVQLEISGDVLSTADIWWCNDATALVGYVKLMMMMMKGIRPVKN